MSDDPLRFLLFSGPVSNNHFSMVQLRKTLELANTLLAQNHISFALIGGFALSAHGISRATKDIHLLVDGQFKVKVKKIFMGAGFSVFFESSEILQLNGPGYLDIVFANRPLSISMLKESQLKLLGVSVVAKEALIGLKIQAYKNDTSRTLQDKADIQALLKTGKVDLKQVKSYADLFEAWPEIEELLFHKPMVQISKMDTVLNGFLIDFDSKLDSKLI